MKKITAEAFEDTSRPEGGHAVILIVGLNDLPDNPTFRLRPIDAGLAADHRGLWMGRAVSPLATRQTERGTEFVVGPDVVDNPLLLAGTAVSIEFPEAMVRGEFLWPNVTSLAKPKRRHIAPARRHRGAEATSEPEPVPSPADAVLADESLASTGAESHAPATGTGMIVLPHSDGTNDGWGEVLKDTDAVQLRQTAPKSRTRAATAIHWFGRVQLGAAAALASAMIASVLLLQAARDRAAREADEISIAQIRKPATGPGALLPSSAVPAVMKAVAVPPAAVPATCDVPQISTDPLIGGRMRIRFTSPCHAAQDLKLTYAGAEFVRKVDASGNFDEIVDCFAGQSSSVDVNFAGGKSKSVPVVAQDLDRVTKIAVFWQAPVNLDLHVFEYAAKSGQKGHVWANAASDAAQAQEALILDHRGHGFMSTIEDGSAGQRKVEVYTLFNYNEQAPGLITMAVDHQTRGQSPNGATCRGGALAEIPFNISIFDRKGQVTSQAGILGAADCGTQLTTATRFDDSVLTPLKIGK